MDKFIKFMKDVFVNLKIKESVYRELKIIKNLLEIQDKKDYTISQVVNELINFRMKKGFKLPLKADIDRKYLERVN